MERTWFFLVCCFSIAVAAHTNSNLTTDQSALLALKAHVTSDPNMILTNWSTNTPTCTWVGVTCGANHFRVAVLNLSYMGLTGTIPPDLGNLSFLVELRFANNCFHGHLPEELARLHQLKLIGLAYNSFSGLIPSWFGSLSKLQTFNLTGNQFSGSIPSAIFNLSALKVINLSHNQLSGSIPREIGNLTMLKRIFLDDNKFTEIPNEISTLNQLEKLYVQLNSLMGHVPMAIFNISSLTTLTFYGNNLSGSLSDNICQHLPSIQVLDFSYNQFHGPLPSKCWQCKRLLQLGLSNNNFSGSIPNNIGNLTQIKAIYLDINHLTVTGPVNFNFNLILYCTIPHEIGQLPYLEELSLGINNLKGLIPSSIFNMSTITKISLSNNQLSGNLPTNIGHRIPILQVLYLGINKLSGVIPKSISNVSKLTDLDLDRNFFSGFIPSTLCVLTNLEQLKLFHNNLTIDSSTPEVNILSCLANLKNLKELAFSTNPLNVRLPVSFKNLSTSLQYIYLSNCNMRGNIPNDIGNLSNLIVLNLAENQLSGLIPTSTQRLYNLQGLYLYDKRLQGYIPNEVCQLNYLAELILYGNQLTGCIPSCLGNLTAALRILSIGSNLLNSTIPSTLWDLTDILQVNLSSNSLSGSLSQGVGNLKVATDILLSYNQLSGTIPSNIGGLQDLVNLDLGNNKLEGSIPSSLGNSLSLKFLDLSKNQLFGVIPKSLEALSYLQYMNLSFNKLQGEIPTDGPFRNFSAQSFVSNHGLCGPSRFHVPPCKKRSGRSILKYVIPGILSIMLILTSIWMLMLHRKKNVKSATGTTLPQFLWRRVSYQELLSTTNGFHEGNLLGTGGFGSVYAGTLSDGIDVAIKVFNLELEGASTSFDVECEMLSNIRHRNLIKVISCCSQIDFKAVVLNYMPNGSLDKWLYSPNYSLNILQRLNILIDVSSALEYLHHGYETPIVHCDLKPRNILLDNDMGAHVTDFGIAKLLGGGDSMTRTMTLATIGYMAPEYGMEGIITKGADVYSFGIVMMETLIKRKPTDDMFVGEMSLKQWVANSLYANAVVDVVDTDLLQTEEDDDIVSKRDCLSSLMQLALSCSAESSEERINMQEALATLNKIKIKFLKNAAAVVLNPRAEI